MGTPNQKRLAELGQLPDYMKKGILIEVQDLRGQVKKLKKENLELLDKISILEKKSDKNVEDIKDEAKEENPKKRQEIMKELKEKGIKFKPSMKNLELLELLK